MKPTEVIDEIYPKLTRQPRIRFLIFLPAVLLMLIIIMVFVWCVNAEEIEGTASWYSIASCLREGTSGIMANGKPLDDSKLTCAKWGVKFGTKYKVTNLKNNKSIIVVVTDRGPAKKLVRQGRVIDLSRAAFQSIADLKQGLISVRVEEIK